MYTNGDNIRLSDLLIDVKPVEHAIPAFHRYITRYIGSVASMELNRYRYS